MSKRLLIVLLLLVAAPVFAADTGYVNPATWGPNVNEWNPGTTLNSSDDTRTEIRANNAGKDEEDAHMGANNFSVPSGATIDSVAVSIEAHNKTISPISKVGHFQVSLVKGGTTVGTYLRIPASGTDFGGTDTVEERDETPATWGTTLSSTDVNATNFGFYAYVCDGDDVCLPASGDARIRTDHVTLKVTYTPSGGGAARRRMITMQ